MNNIILYLALSLFLISSCQGDKEEDTVLCRKIYIDGDEFYRTGFMPNDSFAYYSNAIYFLRNDTMFRQLINNQSEFYFSFPIGVKKFSYSEYEVYQGTRDGVKLNQLLFLRDNIIHGIAFNGDSASKANFYPFVGTVKLTEIWRKNGHRYIEYYCPSQVDLYVNSHFYENCIIRKKKMIFCP